MSEKVVLDEGGSVSVHTRIKDMCKAARNRLGYTNQDICDKISERFGIEDFSVNTVNNFFSERSKATTIYTTGYICAVLGISIDAVFGIENKNSTPEEVEFVKQLAELKVETRFEEQKIEYLEKAAEAYEKMASVIGILETNEKTGEDGLADKLMDLILEIRQEARQEKNWKTADKIRDGLKALGIVIEDSKNGARWKKA